MILGNVISKSGINDEGHNTYTVSATETADSAALFFLYENLTLGATETKDVALLFVQYVSYVISATEMADTAALMVTPPFTVTMEAIENGDVASIAETVYTPHKA